MHVESTLDIDPPELFTDVIVDLTLCEICQKNKLKYKRKDKKLCRYCWDREEFPQFAMLTDDELDKQRDIGKEKSSQITRSIINMDSIGFK